MTPLASSRRSNSGGWLEASAPGALTVQERSIPLSPPPKSNPLKGRGGNRHCSNCRRETWNPPAHLPLHSISDSLWTSGAACQVAALQRDQKKKIQQWLLLYTDLQARKREKKRERTASMCHAMKGLGLKPPEKQTLNLNVNESAEETSEALVSLQGADSSGLKFMAPFTSPLPFSAPSAREVRKGKKTLILTLTPHFHPGMQLLNYLLAGHWSKVEKQRHAAQSSKGKQQQRSGEVTFSPCKFKKQRENDHKLEIETSTIRLPAPSTKFLLSHRLNRHGFSCANQAAQERCFPQAFRDRLSP